MTRTPDASAVQDPRSPLQARLLALLQAGDIDGALQAGLMDCRASDAPADAPIRAAQERLRDAWDARERHRARQVRLARQATERTAARAAIIAPVPAPAPAPTAGAVAATAAPALPAAAAAALARARAKAAGRPSQ